MSARLIGLIDRLHQHDLQDDLESSIYVLLWMTLMYSFCSNASYVPDFLSSVLDPQPRGKFGCCCLGKADFLQARTFLKQVDFPNRTALHTLILDLAKLFSVRYESKPIKAESANLADSDAIAMSLEDAYESCLAVRYNQRIQNLTTHDYTISLFNAALLDRSAWPCNDFAVKQNFQLDMLSLRSQVIKTDWNTEAFVFELNKGGVNLVDVVSDSEQSDGMTVCDDSDIEALDSDMIIDA
jgi:hypothetical protein